MQSNSIQFNDLTAITKCTDAGLHERHAVGQQKTSAVNTNGYMGKAINFKQALQAITKVIATLATQYMQHRDTVRGQSRACRASKSQYHQTLASRASKARTQGYTNGMPLVNSKTEGMGHLKGQQGIYSQSERRESKAFSTNRKRSPSKSHNHFQPIRAFVDHQRQIGSNSSN
jgi:hypothetical protein